MAGRFPTSLFAPSNSHDLAQELAQIRTMIVKLQARAAVLEAMPHAIKLHQEMLCPTPAPVETTGSVTPLPTKKKLH